MRGTRPLTWLGLVVGLAFGLLLSFLPAADASRNASGTYSLPVAPFVSGAVIRSADMNSNFSDLKTEMTDSLSRSGKGAMLAPLELVNGTVGTPALSFDSDTDTGIYRPDAGDIGFTADGVLVCQMHGAGVLVNGQITAYVAPGVDGYGVYATGGVNRNGVRGIATDAVAGVYGIGGPGVFGIGINAASGGEFQGGPSFGYGITANGTGTKEGGYFTCGSAATGGTRQNAVTLSNGDLNMSGVADPTSTTSVSDALTPVSFIKAWGKINLSGGTATVAGGLNITSASCASNELTVTIGADFSSANYAISALTTNGAELPFISNQAAGSFVIGAKDGAGVVVNLCSSTHSVHVMAIGAQ